MTHQPFTEALAELAHRIGPQITRIFDCVGTTAPAQHERLVAWLGQCAARETAAATGEVLAGAVRDLVTLRNGQLIFVARPMENGRLQEPLPVADVGGAVALGQAVIDLLRCVADHDRDLAMRLVRETEGTDARQRKQIARAFG